MAENLVEFTDDNFQASVLDAQGPVLVDFWAPWCGPCRMLTPTIEELAGDYEGKAKVGKLNTDENPQTAASFKISAIPTVLLFNNGEEVQRIQGVQAKDRFTAAIDAQLA